jgi:RimJ/RimL family protein N-acetyltransferase
MMSRGYRELRLEGLKNHPEAFSSSWEDESGKPDAWWAERLETSTVFAAGSTLRRCSGSLASGCMPPPNCGTRRVLWGMYVRPAARGTGLAVCLVQRVIEHARPLVEEICLTVVASNSAAYRLYSAAGFEQYGLERRALKTGADYLDEVLMARPRSEP